MDRMEAADIQDVSDETSDDVSVFQSPSKGDEACSNTVMMSAQLPEHPTDMESFVPQMTSSDQYQSSATLTLNTGQSEERLDEMEERLVSTLDDPEPAFGRSTLEDQRMSTDVSTEGSVISLHTLDLVEERIIAHHEPVGGEIYDLRRPSDADPHPSGLRWTSSVGDLQGQGSGDVTRGGDSRRSSASFIRSPRSLMTAHRKYSTLDSSSDASLPYLQRQPSLLDIMFENKEKGHKFHYQPESAYVEKHLTLKGER